MTATRGEAIITTATPAAGTAALHSATYIHAAQQAWHLKGNVMISGRNIDRRTVLKAGVAALGSSLSGLSWAQGADDTLTMGVISQQTGTFAYAGDLVLKGAQLAIEERDGKILGKKVNLVVRDDEGKPAVGVRRLTEAISSDKLRYFVGNFSSAVGLAELEVARQEKVLQYAAGGSEDFTGSRCSPYTFQWSANAYTALRATLEIGRAHV